jgi:pilus assembly protein CpaB
MGRRSILLIVAVVIAALGATMIFLYVQGIDNRAEAGQEPVQVLAATEKIEAGESIETATDAGKLDLISVPKDDVVPGALTNTDSLSGQIALAPIYPQEQILAAKFGAVGTETQINIPDGSMAVSVNLSDPARVAGFVSPGSKVAIFFTGAPDAAASAQSGQAPGSTSGFTRLLLPEVDVIGVGTTTVLTSTTTDASGAATTEQLPKTLLTLSLTQEQAQKVIFAQGNGELALGLLNDKSKVRPDGGTDFRTLFK